MVNSKGFTKLTRRGKHMATFITTTGERLTGHDLAALIRKEGRLITGPHVDVKTGDRGTAGVIMD